MASTFDIASLPINLFVAFAIFCRVGGLFMTAPAFGDFSLSPRLRLAAALCVTGALAPVMAPYYPALDGVSNIALPAIIAGEILFGAFLGVSARMFVSALNVAGQIIAFQMGLSLAQIFDPTQELQGAIVGGFLAVLGTTMIFATDLHHVMLAALKDSYLFFAPGVVPSFGALSEVAVDTLSSAFSIGLRLAAPFVLFGLVFYVGAGVLNRLMPQAQVFFMLMPANLALGIALLMVTTGVIMSVFLAEFEAFLALFLG